MLRVLRCERDTGLVVCVSEHAPARTHLAGAHLLGYCIQCPTDGTFKVTVSDMQIATDIKVQFSEKNQL